MRKWIALLLVLAMGLALFTGCGNKEPAATEAPAASSSSSAEPAPSSDQEIVTVKVSYPCLVVVPSPDATVAVEEAINNHLAEIGSRVRMKLDPVDGMSYATTIDMQQIGGEEVDLYMALGNLSDMVNSNKVQPITDYVHTVLQPALDLTGDTLIDATTFYGEVYGFPCYKTTALTYYLVVDTEVAENDLGLKLGDKLTIDQVTEKLAILHEKYPSKIAMGVRPGANGSPNNFCLSALYGTAEYYKVVDLGNGVCTIGDEPVIRNMYDSDYFMQVCKTAYAWNQAGYVNKDASVATEEGYDLLKADRAMSYIIGYGGYNPRITDGASDSTHQRSVMYIPITSTMNTPSGLDWCVSYSCKNPEAACEALSLFYTDSFVMNTLLCGVEGRDYVDTGLGTAEDKVVDFPEGLDAFSVPYYAYFTCGIMGNEYLDWVYVKADGTFEDKRADNLKFMQDAVPSPVYGFTMDTANIKNAAAAISNVETQYLGGLLTGELDPEVYIPEFLAALESAGINDVVAEAQTQLDAWVAAK